MLSIVTILQCISSCSSFGLLKRPNINNHYYHRRSIIREYYYSSFASSVYNKHPNNQQQNKIFVTATASSSLEGNGAITELKHIDRVYCISDLHTDNTENMQWLREYCTSHKFGASDLIIVAGDISHQLSILNTTLTILKQNGANVLFVPGNHEAWLETASVKRNDEEIKNGSSCLFTSFDKLEQVYHLCHELGVLTGCTMIRRRQKQTTDDDTVLWIVPLECWYDATLSLDNCNDLCTNFYHWPWMDFFRCQWPQDLYPPSVNNDNTGKIPLGLTEYFLQQNEMNILTTVQNSIRKETSNNNIIMTVSHFLPNQQCLPDWKNLQSTVFRREEWLDHGAGTISAKFAKVAGSALLDEQIRSIQANNARKFRQMHIFGHSHRPKDFEHDRIRYIHNPLGKPKERNIRMVSPNVNFQLIWEYNTTNCSCEVKGETILRYWEEKGGGLDALQLRMRRNKKKIVI